MAISSTLHAATPNLVGIDPRGLSVRTIAYHRRAEDEPLERRIQRQEYDSDGRLVSQWDARLWALTEAGAAVPANQTSVYGLSHQVLSHNSVDAGWRVSLSTESGQILCRRDSRGSDTRYEYDALLRPVAVFETARLGSERCIERLQYAGPDEGAATHNLCGRCVRHDDPAGSQMVLEAGLNGSILFQSRHFLSTEAQPDWPLPEAQRNGLLEPGAGVLTRQQFGALGELLVHIDAKGHRQRSVYTVAGQLFSTKLQLMGEAEQAIFTAVSYSAFGDIEHETAGNGVSSHSCYSPINGRLEQLIARKADGTLLQHLTYSFDPVGNIISIRDSSKPVRYFKNQSIEPLSTYRYDTLYQLVEATGRESRAGGQKRGLPVLKPILTDPDQLANYTQVYSYDAGGNLTTLRHVGAQSFTREMQVDANSNRSVEKDGGDPATAFDTNGNQQQLQSGCGLTWDLRNQLNQLIQVRRINAVNDFELYVYNSEGRRVRKIHTVQARKVAHRTEVRYLSGLELRTNSVTGESLQVIDISAGRSRVRVLHWESGRPEEVPNDQVRYNLSDHLGSSNLELDQQARLISQEGYYPYGGTAWWAGHNVTEAKYKVIRYSGKELDASGLYYYGFRYYAPWLNRWINPDPAGDIDGLNLYRFVANSPISLVDGDGRMFERVVADFGFNNQQSRGKFVFDTLGSHQLSLAAKVAFSDELDLSVVYPMDMTEYVKKFDGLSNVEKVAVRGWTSIDDAFEYHDRVNDDDLPQSINYELHEQLSVLTPFSKKQMTAYENLKSALSKIPSDKASLIRTSEYSSKEHLPWGRTVHQGDVVTNGAFFMSASEKNEYAKKVTYNSERESTTTLVHFLIKEATATPLVYGIASPAHAEYERLFSPHRLFDVEDIAFASKLDANWNVDPQYMGRVGVVLRERTGYAGLVKNIHTGISQI